MDSNIPANGLFRETGVCILVCKLLSKLDCYRKGWGRPSRKVAELARHANAKVTLTVYDELNRNGREKVVAKLAQGGFGG